MKKLLLILVVSSISCCAIAQESNMDKQDTSMYKKGHMKKECLMMMDGKMMTMKNGKSMMMDNSMKLNNGTMVMTDGTVKMADGTTKMLKEGQCINMDGKMWMMKKKMKKDMK